MDSYGKNSIDAVLRVLLLTLYADRVKKPEETAEVQRLLPELAIFADGKLFEKFPDLDTLVAKHDAEVQEALDASSLLAFTADALAAIDDPLLIPSVLDAMRAIAHADEEFHHTEQHLIARAEQLWGFAAG